MIVNLKLSLVVACMLLSSSLTTARYPSSNNRTVYILSLLPNQSTQLNPSESDGQTIALALDMAAERINSQTEILPEYRIELIHADSGGCNGTIQAYMSILDKLYYSPYNVAGVIGPVCSSSSLALSSLLSRKDISLVTLHGGKDPALADRNEHHFALGSLGSSESFSQFVIKLTHKSNWTRIAVLYDEFDRSHSATINRLFDDFVLQSKKGYVSPVSKTYLLPPLTDIVNQYLRVVFLFLPLALTQRVLCIAQHRGMVYSDYQWVIIENTFDEVAQNISFTYEGKQYECSEEEMKTSALNRAYFLKFRLSAQNETAPTISGHSFEEYDRDLQKKIEQCNSQNSNFNISHSSRTTYFYDSLWALSVALDGLARKQPSLDLSSYKHGDYELSNMLLDELYNVDFNGVSGRFAFNSTTGFVTRTLSLFQVVDERLALVADYHDGKFNKVGSFTSIPDDFENQITTVADDLVPLFAIVCALELLVVIVLHVLTVLYRDRPSVKAASFSLNQLIYLGCYCNLFTTFLIILQNHSKINDSSCILIHVIQNFSALWLNPVWPTLILGPVIARTWRLYRIFTHYLNPGPFIGTKFLLSFVFVLVCINLVFSTLWTAIDRFQPRDIIIEGTTRPQIYIRLWRSRGNNSIFWGAIGSAYSTFLFLVAILLAFLTRNIQNQSFSTKSLRVFAYLEGGVAFLYGIFANLLQFLLSAIDEDNQVKFPFIFTVASLNLFLLVIIALLILPPLLPIFREVLCNSKLKRRNV